MSELWKKGVVEPTALIRSRNVSCREVIDAHLLRIAHANADLNAVTVILADTALQAANAADRALKAGEPAGELCGIPFTVKEGYRRGRFGYHERSRAAQERYGTKGFPSCGGVTRRRGNSDRAYEHAGVWHALAHNEWTARRDEESGGLEPNSRRV